MLNRPRGVTRTAKRASRLVPTVTGPVETFRHASSIELVPCPIINCSARIKPNRVNRHLRKVHAISKGTSVQSQRQIVVPMKSSSRAKTSLKRASTKAPSMGLVPCPWPACSAKMNPRNVGSHLKKVHRSTSYRNDSGPTVQEKQLSDSNLSAAVKAAIYDSIPEVFSQTRTHGARLKNDSDVTVSYAHFYRDGGRFGSHSSHDGFDDESGPD